MNNVIDFYSAAEKKTSTVGRRAAIFVLCSYDAILVVILLKTIIIKIILEKCESDPITWDINMKMKCVMCSNVQIFRIDLSFYFFYSAFLLINTQFMVISTITP